MGFLLSHSKNIPPFQMATLIAVLNNQMITPTNAITSASLQAANRVQHSQRTNIDFPTQPQSNPTQPNHRPRIVPRLRYVTNATVPCHAMLCRHAKGTLMRRFATKWGMYDFHLRLHRKITKIWRNKDEIIGKTQLKVEN